MLSLGLALFLSACVTKPKRVGADLSGAMVSSVKNVVKITRDDRVTWNGRAVTDAQLVALMALARSIPSEPELYFQPEPGASYDRSARILEIVKQSGATKFGFIGNAQYAEDEQPAP